MKTQLVVTYHIYLTFKQAPRARDIPVLSRTARRLGWRCSGCPIDGETYLITITGPGAARAKRRAMQRWVIDQLRVYMQEHPEDGCD